MTRLVRTARAEEDLIELWLYIAQDDRRAADTMLDRIDEACVRLSQNPGIGPARPDLAPNLRYYVVGNYLILYRETLHAIEIVRVVHGARRLPDLI